MSFKHLHVHSDYTILRSSLRISQYVQTALESHVKSGNTGVAVVSLADCDNMYGAVEFYYEVQKTAKTMGVEAKALIGLDVSMELAEGGGGAYRFVLYAKDYEGYRSLMKLSSRSFTEGLSGEHPRLTWKILKEHAKSLIFLSGGIEGVGYGQVRDGRIDKAEEFLLKMTQILPKEDVYVELVRHGLPREEETLTSLMDMAGRLGLRSVAANEVFYLTSGERQANDVFWAIGTGDVMSTPENKKTKLRGEGYHLRSEGEMRALFAGQPDALMAVEELVAKCHIIMPKVQPHMPKVDISSGVSVSDELRRRCFESMTSRGLDETSYGARLDFEVGVIAKMGFSDYFLIVGDFIGAAKRMGVLVGPGRGSAAGSLVAYLLGITNIDPIKEDLLFERFLNPERVSMPDIDIDFQDNRRDEVIEYCKQKYGHDKIAQIVTFGKLKAKAIFKDVARVYEVPFQEANEISAFIEDDLAESFSGSSEFRQRIQSRPVLQSVYDTSLSLEGLTRQTGVHASGVIMADAAIEEYAPVCLDKEGNLCTQYEGTKLEGYCGLIKMDFLGLSTLTIIDEAVGLVKKHEGITLNMDTLNMGDAKVYELFAQGRTTGLFQFESNGMRRYLKELRPTAFGDLVAMNAMFRPGPMKWIPVYIAKKNRLNIEFDSEEDKQNFSHLEALCLRNDGLRRVLSPTNLIPIYQEQIMEIGRVYAGFTLGEADLMRRAMGKKDVDVLLKLKEDFMVGGEKLGNMRSDSEFLFEKIIMPFSGYGFNKSHSASYAFVAFQVAYLKAHHPVHLFCALMNADIERPAKLKQFVEDAFSMGLIVTAPDVNLSGLRFEVNAEGHIVYPLSALKGIADSAGANIIEERGTRPYSSLFDFLRRLSSNTKVNKASIEQLIRSGSFSKVETLSPSSMLSAYPKVVDRLEHQKQRTAGGQMDLMSIAKGVSDTTPVESDFKDLLSGTKVDGEDELLKYEEQSIGFSFAQLSKWSVLSQFMGLNTADLDDTAALTDKASVDLVGFYTDYRNITTKAGDAMSMFKLTNAQGNISCVCFPKVHEKVLDVLNTMEDGIVVVKGRIQKDARGVSLIVNDMKDVNNLKKVEERMERNAERRQAKAHSTSSNPTPATSFPSSKYPHNPASKSASPPPPPPIDYSAHRLIVISMDETQMPEDALERLRTYLMGNYGGEVAMEFVFMPSATRLSIPKTQKVYLSTPFLEGIRAFPFVTNVDLK